MTTREGYSSMIYFWTAQGHPVDHCEKLDTGLDGTLVSSSKATFMVSNKKNISVLKNLDSVIASELESIIGL